MNEGRGREIDMTPIEWIAAGQLAVGAVGFILVWQGLQQMRRAGDQREKREDARHREAMRALEVLIERTGGSRGEGTRA